MISYRQLPNEMYTDISPTAVKNPEILVFNGSLADELGLDLGLWQDKELLSGNKLPEEFTPIAQAYYGHQFGHLVELGDGRAILLQEVLTSAGERFDIQLKGSGRTPYSRRGDGRATVGPMLREYLVSEAMHKLGIPTSRSLAVVSTGETVYRDKPYPGAILTRVASSHLRVGTLQFANAHEVEREVSDYIIQRHFPECREAKRPYLAMFEAIASRQAELIAKWLSFGFIHGVMNTDNMALSGETIDYGPCAFMDIYQGDQVFSSIDHLGRYRYNQQGDMARWNLARLAETLLPIVDEDAQTAVNLMNEKLEKFHEDFQLQWLLQFSRKLGLEPSIESKQQIEHFLVLLEEEKLDFTNAFLSLSEKPDEDLFQSEAGRTWQKLWQKTRNREVDLLQYNPRVIPRNRKLNEVLEAAEKGNLTPFLKMLEIVTDPYALSAPEEFMKPQDPDESFVTYCGT